MSPSVAKKTRKSLTLEVKLDIIHRHESVINPLHFRLVGWQRISGGGGFDWVGGARDMNVKLASQSVGL
ncbi:hypothetical protein E2C01_013154 [Portunus trituberculatus]|uniref:Uncharacterized protein n=1 Tax=Portunus trituberculatus TaxID=210409 RepID=A0A5B7DGB8_PORTR|nr:hypothetical protein [Portunus trituberculatus]